MIDFRGTVIDRVTGKRYVFDPPVLPIDEDSSFLDRRLALVCRYIVGRNVAPEALQAALVGCLLMGQGDESAAADAVARAEIALGLWGLTDEPDGCTVTA